MAESGSVIILDQTQGKEVANLQKVKKRGKVKDRNRAKKVAEHFNQVAPEILYSSAKSQRQYNQIRKLISLKGGGSCPFPLQ